MGEPWMEKGRVGKEKREGREKRRQFYFVNRSSLSLVLFT